MASVYEINKGINRSIEFKGIKAQYITYLAVGLVLVLLIFAILYASGVNLYICLGIIIPGAAALIAYVKHMSKNYGEHGLVKRMAARRLPASLQCRSRRPFTTLKSPSHDKQQTV